MIKKNLSQQGFSILELLTAIAVVSIIAAIGFPAINNFGVSENFQNDIAVIRSQFNQTRQLALENGNVYRILIVNDDINNTARLEVYEDQTSNRFNKLFHLNASPPCSGMNGSTNTNPGGVRINDLTKNLEHFTIKKCNALTGGCTAVSNVNNSFCILPDGTGPENARALIQASSNAGNKTDFFHIYETGFFNIGERIQ